MYIEYITPQRPVNRKYTVDSSSDDEYRPTWLIRTSDWKKVHGHQATDGYHALSYCWEQSGEKFQLESGKFDLVDRGHHRITKPEKEPRRLRNLFRRRRKVPVTREVTYDLVLKQICMDFDIDYLWYDKVCINQMDKQEKKREIKQMHRIYSNALYTVAFVPEIHIDDPAQFERKYWMGHHTEADIIAHRIMEESLWWTRSWTLEELLMSTLIVVVGKNTHFWSLAYTKQNDSNQESGFLAHQMLGFKDKKLKMALHVLQKAHFRTSSKGHDHVFALANVFNDRVFIDIDYDADVSTVVNDFYRQLTMADLSVMCFGSNLYPVGVIRCATTMADYQLPSWTGVAGLHLACTITDIVLDQNCSYNIDNDMRLRIKCRSYTIHPTKFAGHDFYMDDERLGKADSIYSDIFTSMDDFEDERAALDWSQWCMVRSTNCYATHYWKPDDDHAFCSPVLALSLTEGCDECIILGVIFSSVLPVTLGNKSLGNSYDYFSPVLKKSDNDTTFKAIGVIQLKRFMHNEPHLEPQDLMDKMFDKHCSEGHEFFII